MTFLSAPAWWQIKTVALIIDLPLYDASTATTSEIVEGMWLGVTVSSQKGQPDGRVLVRWLPVFLPWVTTTGDIMYKAGWADTQDVFFYYLV